MRYARIEYIKEGDYDIKVGHLYEVICINESGCYILDDEAVMQVVDINQVTIVYKDDLEDNVVRVKYFDDTLPRLEVTSLGDCIDLRVSQLFKVDTPPNEPSKVGEEVSFPYSYKKGDTLFFKLGVGMKLPGGYKANVYPRSSTFKNYGFILTNSVGIIDNAYYHEGDEWGAMVYCTRDGVINYGERVFQFEPVPVYTHNFVYEEVDKLDEGARGSYGSTGVD